MVREILINWTTAAGGGQVSVMNFLEVTPVADQRAALAAALAELEPLLATTTTWTVATTGREWDDATGALTGAWAEGTPYTDAGSAADQAPDAAQALIRWQTGNIVGGRFLQGRTFIPGLGESSFSGGNLGGSSLGWAQAFADSLITDAVQFAIWHRPVGGSDGVAWAVESGAPWPEVAVLRRRRK
jgi:hypothetical protein